MNHVYKIYPLLFILFFIQNPLQAQIIGGNGEGLTIVLTDEDIPYLQELTKLHPIAIRWPGGGDSKLAFPSLHKNGLGLNKDSIRLLFEEFRDPKGLVKQENLDKDLRKADGDLLKTKSALQELIDLSQEVDGFQVAYCLNVIQGTVESNISAIKTLVDSGVHVISVIAGNETFYMYNYNFENYRKDFEPIMRACEKEFPTIPRLLCAGQEIYKKDHIAWNNKLFQYIRENGAFISGVDVHYYLMEELKEAIAIHPQFVVFDPDSSYKSLGTAFDKYISLTNEDNGMSELVAYLRKNLPDKIYYCTEFGDKHAEYWSNTVANAGRIFVTFCKHRNDFEILLVHNLIANWLWAGRRPVGKLDFNPANANKINRVHWYSIQMANELPYETPLLPKQTSIANAGEYFFYFNNTGADAWLPAITIGNHKIKLFEIHSVSGKHTYSSAGQTGFMEKNSKPSCEVTGIQVLESGRVEAIPFNSFGYVRILVE